MRAPCRDRSNDRSPHRKGTAMPRLDDQPLTMQLADWVATTSQTQIPTQVRHQVKRVIVDYLAATILGSQAEPATIVRDYVRRRDTDASSTVIATDLRLSAEGAALVNGTAAHAYDVDDGYTPGGCHPSGPVVSAALAAAEPLKSDAEQLVRAIALGYEVACRLAGSTHPAQRQRSFHNTPLAGVFGATAAVAALLDLDATRIANAFGLAGSHAGGLQAYLDQGSDVKRYHAGKAARDGVVSAELAGSGLTAPTTVLEGAHGYLQAFAGGECDVDHLIGDLGTIWRMTRTYNKPYPCCRHLHGAVDAALQIRDNHGLDPDSIETVHVETFAIAASLDNTDIHHLLDAQMSLPYAVAAALIHGQLGMEQFQDNARHDPRITTLLDTIQVTEDKTMTHDYPTARPARVTIRSRGQNHLAEVPQPLGEPDNPISDDGLTNKFQRLTTPIIDTNRCQDILEAAWTLNDPNQLYKTLADA